MYGIACDVMDVFSVVGVFVKLCGPGDVCDVIDVFDVIDVPLDVDDEAIIIPPVAPAGAADVAVGWLKDFI